MQRGLTYGLLLLLEGSPPLYTMWTRNCIICMEINTMYISFYTHILYMYMYIHCTCTQGVQALEVYSATTIAHKKLRCATMIRANNGQLFRPSSTFCLPSCSGRAWIYSCSSCISVHVRALLRTLCCLVCFSFSSSSSLFRCMLSLHSIQQVHVHEETNMWVSGGDVKLVCVQWGEVMRRKKETGDWVSTVVSEWRQVCQWRQVKNTAGI